MDAARGLVALASLGAVLVHRTGSDLIRPLRIGAALFGLFLDVPVLSLPFIAPRLWHIISFPADRMVRQHRYLPDRVGLLSLDVLSCARCSSYGGPGCTSAGPGQLSLS